jgi:hypothetical protein
MKNDPRGWYRLLRSPARDSARESVVMERELPDGSVERVRLVRWQVFERWRRRAAIAFVGLVIVSTFAVYLGDHARRAATAGLSAEAQRAIRRSCEDRVDVRITVAAGFDELRRFAIDSGEPDGGAARRRVVAGFLERTQPPSDRLLSEAAGATVKTTGEVQPETVFRVRDMAQKRCKAQAERFAQGVDG